MRLNEISENDNILNDDPKSGSPFTEKELQFMFNIVYNNGESMDYDELKDKVNQAYIDYTPTRSKRSLLIACIVMHSMIHGILPYGCPTYSGRWQVVFGNMARFGEEKGYDVSSNMKHAEEEAKNRAKIKNKKDALLVMSNYYKQNKYSPEQIQKLKQNRESLLNLIQKGIPPDKAFQQILS
jgi:hypothetical protein